MDRYKVLSSFSYAKWISSNTVPDTTKMGLRVREFSRLLVCSSIYFIQFINLGLGTTQRRFKEPVVSEQQRRTEVFRMEVFSDAIIRIYILPASIADEDILAIVELHLVHLPSVQNK